MSFRLDMARSATRQYDNNQSGDNDNDDYEHYNFQKQPLANMVSDSFYLSSVHQTRPHQHHHGMNNNNNSIMMDVAMGDETDSSSDSGNHDVCVVSKDPKVMAASRNAWKRSRRGRWLYHGLFAVAWIVVLSLSLKLIRLRKDIDSANTGFAPAFAIRINSGSSQPYRDSVDREWLADYFEFVRNNASSFTDLEELGPGQQLAYTVTGDGYLYNSALIHPETLATPILNYGVEGEGLYRDERFFTTQGLYEIVVPAWNAWYTVQMHFCELYHGEAGQRVFDVYLEDELVYGDFDIFKVAGGNFTALTLTEAVYVADGSLSIRLVSQIEHAKISGIQVTQLV
jgi:Malectin domain